MGSNKFIYVYIKVLGNSYLCSIIDDQSEFRISLGALSVSSIRAVCGEHPSGLGFL